jgi:TPR repeat protein
MALPSLGRSVASLIALCAAAAACAQPLTGLTPQEIEARNAAVGFFLPQASTLSVVRDECRGLLKDASPSPDQVAHDWWKRNRAELDAINAWLQRSMSALQASNPSAHRAASMELLRSSNQALVENLRTMFKRQLPTSQTCLQALARYQAPQFDMLALAQNPGYERLAEFPATLLRMEQEPGYQPPQERYRSYDVQVPSGQFGLLASLDAAQRAGAVKDWPGVLAAYASMAERGDVRAALSAGYLLHRGELAGQEPSRAYYWYHRAYAMGSPAGLSQLGVLWRDGTGVSPDLRLATAAFLVAAADNRDPKESTQSLQNAQELLAQMTPEQRAQVGCMTRAALDEALAAPLKDKPGVTRPQLAGADRTIGEISPIALRAQGCH